MSSFLARFVLLSLLALSSGELSSINVGVESLIVPKMALNDPDDADLAQGLSSVGGVGRLEDVLPELLLEESLNLVHGKLPLCGYTGETKNVSRHFIPQLRMNDGPQGFRGPREKSTSFPCGLAMAATFDKDMVFQWAKQIAVEFAIKGSNTVLGPGVNMLRVPENGRTFEYLSGEDPILGAAMTEQAVKGVSSVPRMMAVAKHFALNNQEANRTRVSVVVDEVTLQELYLVPFRAAVAAGVHGIMCSYNKINGISACENEDFLNGWLKKDMGFDGFVVSDWGATRSAEKAALAGLDMEMPLGINFGRKFKTRAIEDINLRVRVRSMGRRIMRSMKRAGLLGTKDPPCMRTANSSSLQSVLLSRKWAEAGTVLLQNRNNALPIQPTETGFKVALFGEKAIRTNIVHGGGSGQVDAGRNTITAMGGIDRALRKFPACEQGCLSYASGEKSRDVAQALEGASAIVIVVGVRSTEGFDRHNLFFDEKDESLVYEVTKLAEEGNSTAPIVVVAVTPGPIMFRWAQKVDAIALMVFPGQEFGNAIGSILTGTSSPGGRLPFTIPFEDHKMVYTPAQYPGVDLVANYSEGQLTGYRWYDYYDVDVQFPFGFGLSYTSFQYNASSVKLSYGFLTRKWTVSLGLSNVGAYYGDEIVQLYLERFNCKSNKHHRRPPIRPVKKLIAFEKAGVPPGTSVDVHVKFGFHDVREWNVAKKKWELPGKECSYSVLVGSSSRSIHAKVPIKFWLL